MKNITLDDLAIALGGIERFYSEYLKWESRSGSEWKARCPFHDDKNPSLSVNIQSGKWNCFGCNKGGNNFVSFYQEIKGFHEFNDALKALANEAGVKLPGKRGRKPIEWPNIDEKTLEQFCNDLDSNALKYLKSRGILEEVIRKLRVGFIKKEGHLKDHYVWPTFRKGKLFTYRFYRPDPKNRTQIPKDKLKKKPLWLWPEPDPDNEEIILCEGEPDTLCTISKGFNATTITGGAKNWNEDLLPFFKNRKVYICYDIDEAGRLGAISIASKISEEAKIIKIVNLDLDPEKYPTGDLNDYFVKEGKTSDDLKKLIEDSPVIVPTGKDSKVIEFEGAYYSIKRDKDGNVVKEKNIADFTIRLICRYIKDDTGDMVREVVLIDRKTGRKSDSKELKPNEMSTAKMFREFCLSCGDYLYEGDADEMMNIFKIVNAQDPDSKIVRQVNQVGFLGKSNIWIFDNIAIKNGEIIHPDIRGIYWNGQNGYTFTPFDMSKSDVVKHIPSLTISDKDTYETMRQFCNNMIENTGNWNVLLGIGVACGSIYFRDIVLNQDLGCFPILFVYGSSKSGKTEYVSFLMRMFGMEKTDAENLPAVTSTVPISRRLSYFSNIPVWWDEYRDNLPKINSIIGVLRGAYDGSGRSIGVKGPRGILSERISAPAIVSGEHLPADEAFRSRLLPVYIKKAGRNKEYHKEVLRLSRDSSAHIFNLVKNKNDETEKKLVDKIMEFKQQLSRRWSKVHDDRVIKNYAIALGCYNVLANPDDKILPEYIIDGTGIDTLGSDIDEGDKDIYATQDLRDFLDSVQSAIESGAVRKDVSWYHIVEDDDKVYIWLTPIYEAYAERYRRTRGDNPPNIGTIKNWLKDLECYIQGSKQHKIPNKEGVESTNKKCVVLSLHNLTEKISGWFGDKISYIEESNRQNDIPF